MPRAHGRGSIVKRVVITAEGRSGSYPALKAAITAPQSSEVGSDATGTLAVALRSCKHGVVWRCRLHFIAQPGGRR